MATFKEKTLVVSIAFSQILGTPLYAATDGSAQCAGVTAVTGGECSTSGLTVHVNNIIDALFTVVGAIAVIILIIGGIRYITSTGDQKRIQTAKDTILYAVFGIIITILARAIVGFVVSNT